MNLTAKQNALRSAVTILAVLAPVALAAFAFEVSPDGVDRTQIVQVLGRIVEILVGNSGLRNSYFYGMHHAVDCLRSCLPAGLAA
jgi:hypothetical protein